MYGSNNRRHKKAVIPLLQDLPDLEEMEDSEVSAEQVSSSKAGFIRNVPQRRSGLQYKGKIMGT